MKRYLSSIKRYSWIVLLCIVLMTLIGVILVKLQPLVYQVNSTMIVVTGGPGTSFSPSLAPADGLSQSVNDSSEILSRTVMGYVYKSDPQIKKRGYSADDLLLDITTATSATAATIIITATTNNPADAVLLANDVAKGYQSYKQTQLQQQLDQQRKSLQDQYNAYQKQSQNLENQILAINNATDPRVAVWTTDRADIIHNMDSVQAQLVQLPTTIQSNVVVIQLAKVSDIATSSKGPLIIVATAGLGLLIGIGILLLAVFLENRLRGEEQVKERLGLAYLGGISRSREIKETPVRLTGQALQQITDISANLRLTGILAGQWHAPHGAILLVTSAQAAEGKTSVAAALASTVARAGGTVVVVEGDLRKPGAHQAFGLTPSGPGLSGLLKSPGRETVDDIVQRTNIPGVWIVYGGAEMDEPTLLLEQKLPNILAQLRKKADLVIIDGPALLSGAEGSVLATMTDGVALVVDAARDKVPLLLRAKDLLNTLTHTPVGVIMNRLPRRRRNQYYAAAYSGSTTTEKWVPVPAYAVNGNGNENGNGQKPEPVVATPLAAMAPIAKSPLPADVPTTPGGRSVSAPKGMQPEATLIKEIPAIQIPPVQPGSQPLQPPQSPRPSQPLQQQQSQPIQPIQPMQPMQPMQPPQSPGPSGVPNTPGGRPIPRVVPPELPAANKDKPAMQQNLQPPQPPRPAPRRVDMNPPDQGAKK